MEHLAHGISISEDRGHLTITWTKHLILLIDKYDFSIFKYKFSYDDSDLNQKYFRVQLDK